MSYQPIRTSDERLISFDADVDTTEDLFAQKSKFQDLTDSLKEGYKAVKEEVINASQLPGNQSQTKLSSSLNKAADFVATKRFFEPTYGYVVDLEETKKVETTNIVQKILSFNDKIGATVAEVTIRAFSIGGILGDAGKALGIGFGALLRAVTFVTLTALELVAAAAAAAIAVAGSPFYLAAVLVGLILNKKIEGLTNDLREAGQLPPQQKILTEKEYRDLGVEAALDSSDVESEEVAS